MDSIKYYQILGANITRKKAEDEETMASTTVVMILEKRKLNILPWKGLSPALNIIENLCTDVKTAENAKRSKSLTELEAFFQPGGENPHKKRTERLLAAAKVFTSCDISQEGC